MSREMHKTNTTKCTKIKYKGERPNNFKKKKETLFNVGEGKQLIK